MRILHIAPSLTTGGQETMLINIANEQSKEHEVFVIIVNYEYDQRLIELFDTKIKVFKIGRPRSSKNPWYLLKLNIRILQIRPYVIHSHFVELPRYIIPSGYKYIFTIHGYHSGGISPKHLIKNKNIIAVSKGIQQEAMACADVNPIVIYNGVKVDNIQKRNTLQPYDKKCAYKIVQVSRLYHEVKGQDILLKAISILKEKGYHNLHLDFIGEGPSLDYLKNLAYELQLDNVLFLGPKTVEYINENLCNYDLFVQASRHEAFGLTIAEAISAKIPVVISDCEGMMEVVNYGEFGLMFKNGSAEDCASKIEEIINTQYTELQKRVDKAYAFVDKTFNVKGTAQKYVKFYERCK